MLDGSASSFAEIFVDDAGERAIYMAPGATSETTPEHVRAHHADVHPRARARVTTEVSQLPLATALEALAIARAAGVADACVDLDVPPSEAVPGLGDAATLDAVLRARRPAQAVEERGARARAARPATTRSRSPRALRARFGNGAVVVTDGEAGCAIAADGRSRAACRRAPVKRVVDTTGAGDAFLGGLLVALARGPRLGGRRRGSPTPAARPASSSSAPSPRIAGARARARARALRRRRRCAAWRRAARGRAAVARGRAPTALARFDVALEELARAARRASTRRLRRARSR